MRQPSSTPLPYGPEPTEVGDEESLYEVEVRLPDGTSMDVQLDEAYEVVGDKVDDDSSETAAD